MDLSNIEGLSDIESQVKAFEKKDKSIGETFDLKTLSAKFKSLGEVMKELDEEDANTPNAPKEMITLNTLDMKLKSLKREMEELNRVDEDVDFLDEPNKYIDKKDEGKEKGQEQEKDKEQEKEKEKAQAKPKNLWARRSSYEEAIENEKKSLQKKIDTYSNAISEIENSKEYKEEVKKQESALRDDKSAFYTQAKMKFQKEQAKIRYEMQGILLKLGDPSLREKQDKQNETEEQDKSKETEEQDKSKEAEEQNKSKKETEEYLLTKKYQEYQNKLNDLDKAIALCDSQKEKIFEKLAEPIQKVVEERYGKKEGSEGQKDQGGQNNSQTQGTQGGSKDQGGQNNSQTQGTQGGSKDQGGQNNSQAQGTQGGQKDPKKEPTRMDIYNELKSKREKALDNIKELKEKLDKGEIKDEDINTTKEKIEELTKNVNSYENQITYMDKGNLIRSIEQMQNTIKSKYARVDEIDEILNKNPKDAQLQYNLKKERMKLGQEIESLIESCGNNKDKLSDLNGKDDQGKKGQENNGQENNSLIKIDGAQLYKKAGITDRYNYKKVAYELEMGVTELTLGQKFKMMLPIPMYAHMAQKWISNGGIDPKTKKPVKKVEVKANKSDSNINTQCYVDHDAAVKATAQAASEKAANKNNEPPMK
jgi:hypothetical protein